MSGKKKTEKALNHVVSPLMEVRFWTRILKEHASLLQISLPCDQPELIAQAQAFVTRFQTLENRVNQAPTLDPELVQDIRVAVVDIIAYKRRILRMQVTCQLRIRLFPLLLDHVIREAMYFLSYLDTANLPRQGILTKILYTETFWLRIMKEHTEFIIHFLDPSERDLIDQLHEFHHQFSDLLMTACDLRSMAESEPESFNTVLRFTDDVLAATTKLLGFKATAYELARTCQLLSVLPTPLLLDHIRRETEYFLDELQELRGMLCTWCAVDEEK